MLTRTLVGVLACASAPGVLCANPLFFDMGIGQTLFYVPEELAESDVAERDTEGTWPARSLRIGGGLTLANVVSVGSTVWFWGDSDLLADKDEEKNDDTTEVSFPNPELWGSGIDVFARLGLPVNASGSGPYVEYGRLCWAARINHLSEPWQRNSCTARRGLGIAFSPSDTDSKSRTKPLVRAAFHRTNLDEVDLYQFMIDMQLRF